MDVYTDYMKELESDIEKDVNYPTGCTHFTIDHSGPLVATEGQLNLHSIYLEPDNGNLNDYVVFKDLLSEEFKLHMMDATGDMDERRESLCERLKKQKGLVDIIDLIAHSSKNLQALVPTSTCILCVLHSNIRIASKTGIHESMRTTPAS
jgi:hypothetical protein